MTTRPESSVTFPGDSGVFHQRAATNELDADTAHGLQSGGKWSALYAIVDEPAAFSGKAWSFDMGGTTNNVQTDGDDAVALTVEPWAFGVFLEPEDAGDRTYLQVDFFDSGGAALGNSGPIDDVLNTPAGRQARGGTFTPPANTATGKLRVYYREPGGAPVDKVLRWDSIVVRRGTDPTFVPSTYVVGVLDARIDCVLAALGTDMDLHGHNVTGTGGWAVFVRSSDRLALAYNAGSGAQFTAGKLHNVAADQRAVFRVTRDPVTGTIEYFVDGISLGTDSGTVGEQLYDANMLSYVGRPSVIGPLSAQVFGASVLDGEDGPAVSLWVPDEILSGSAP